MLTSRRYLLLIAWSAAVALVLGCYSYRTISTEEVRNDARSLPSLTPVRVTRAAQPPLTLDSAAVVTDTVFGFRTGMPVRFPLADAQAFRVHALSLARTAAVSAVAGGAAVAVLFLTLGREGTTSCQCANGVPCPCGVAGMPVVNEVDSSTTPRFDSRASALSLRALSEWGLNIGGPAAASGSLTSPTARHHARRSFRGNGLRQCSAPCRARHRPRSNSRCGGLPETRCASRV